MGVALGAMLLESYDGPKASARPAPAAPRVGPTSPDGPVSRVAPLETPIARVTPPR